MRSPILLLSSILLLAVLLPHTRALDLASHCQSGYAEDECPCSRREDSGRTFCLAQATSTLCQQQACSSRYVCDCSGDTLCRRTTIHSTLSCVTSLTADATCTCARTSLKIASGSHAPSRLQPLRPRATLRSARKMCSETPSFWSGPMGLKLLSTHWTSVSTDGVLTVGHALQVVSFRSAGSVPRALSTARARARSQDDTRLTTFMEQCIAALLTTRLIVAGISTRMAHEDIDRGIDADHLVLQACPYLPNGHAVVGMSVARFFERARLLDGALPTDEEALSREEVEQGCLAINRNFERCEVDVGCLGVMG